MESPSGSTEPTETAQDPAAMREILERHLLPPAPCVYRVRNCRLSHVRRRDGSRFSVQYDVRFEETGTGRGWDRVVSGVSYGGGRTRRAWKALVDAAPPRADGTDDPVLPPFAYAPELDMLVQVFPHDYRLPAIARLVEEPPIELLPAVLDRFGVGEWGIVGWTADLVRYRVDQRATLRIRARARDHATGREDERAVYAKVYRDEGEGRRGRSAQCAVHDGVVAAGAPFAVAEPVAYDDGLRTLIQAEVAGTSLQAILRQDADPIPAVRAAAKVVAEFHQLGAAAPPRPAGETTKRLRNAQQRLRPTRPDLAAVVSGLADAVDAGLGGMPPVAIHGDLKPDHILFDGDRPALIDFDLLGAGDPFRDVANMVVHLARTSPRASRSGDASGGVVQAFVEEYFARVPDAWGARIPRSGPGGRRRPLAGPGK